MPQVSVAADVVVVGAGIAGMVTALSAAEAGATVILLEKNRSFAARGFHNAAIGSQVQRRMGIEFDTAQALREMIGAQNNQVKESLYWIWAEHSGACMDWVIEKAAAAGLGVELWAGYYKGPDYTEYPVTHVFTGGKNARRSPNHDVMTVLEQGCRDLGVDIRYGESAQQLIQDQAGRIGGVIAGTGTDDAGPDDAGSDDSSTAYLATKGVVLCTGDYGANAEMVATYCPLATRADGSLYSPRGKNTGDGHKMGLAVGAAMQKGAHGPMMHNVTGGREYFFLHVNRDGRRFHNEDVTTQASCTAKLTQPGGVAWALYDDDFLTHVAATLSVGGGFFWDQPDRPMGRPWDAAADRERLQSDVAKGLVLQAETIPELAEKMDVPADALAATASSYNACARRGVDDQFGKRREVLFPVQQPPFYAGPIQSPLLVMCGGLSVNDDSQVLDQNDRPIAGLYAVGNAAGDFFAVGYPTVFPGLSHGRCITFGRLVGLALGGSSADDARDRDVAEREATESARKGRHG
jgi:fumarate reductase flavoprotein subunit